MTQKEIKKLSKTQMLSLMQEQQAEIERLQRELSETRRRLEQGQRGVAEAGSAQEATQALEEVFTQARQAADLYLDRIRELPADQDEQGSEEPGDSGYVTATGVELPTAAQLAEAAQAWKYHRRYIWTMKNTVYTLITVSAAAVLIAVLLMPVLQIFGASMSPTLQEGELIVSLKGGRMETGDIVAFYYNNKILVKRVIGQAGQWIDIDEDGTVYVDGAAIDEPYLIDKAFGECDLTLPYQVPESRVFVMGDNRSVSVDSRSTTVGCVAEEQLVGRAAFRVWPLSRFGKLERPAEQS